MNTVNCAREIADSFAALLGNYTETDGTSFDFGCMKVSRGLFIGGVVEEHATILVGNARTTCVRVIDIPFVNKFWYTNFDNALEMFNDQPLSALVGYVYDRIRHQWLTSFTMVGHPRLGSDSCFQGMDKDVLKKICDMTH